MSRGNPVVYTVAVGQRFGRGVVIDPEARLPSAAKTHTDRRAVKLLCDCGNTYMLRLLDLVASPDSKRYLSCGCYHTEQAIRHFNPDLTTEQVEYTQELLDEGFDSVSIAHELGMPASLVNTIKSGKYSRPE
jgi:hypothetical protein